MVFAELLKIKPQIAFNKKLFFIIGNIGFLFLPLFAFSAQRLSQNQNQTNNQTNNQDHYQDQEANSSFFAFNSTIPVELEVLLKEDFEYLRSLQFSKIDPDLLKVLNFSKKHKHISGQELYNWLFTRIHYFVGESFDVNRNFVDLGDPSGALARLPLQKTAPVYVNPAESKKARIEGPQVILSNLGRFYFEMGQFYRQERQAYQHSLVVVFDGRAIPINSPRTGILQLGPGFMRLEKNRINLFYSRAESNRINRLALFFHEARHSDENEGKEGQALSFPHIACSKGHDFYALPACDSSTNGSYAVQGLVLRQLLGNCQSCQESEILVIKNTILDCFSRIVISEKSLKNNRNILSLKAELKPIIKSLKLLAEPVEIEELIRKHKEKINRLNEYINTFEFPEAYFLNEIPD